MHRASRIGEFAFELRENGEVIGAATNDAASKIAFERIEYAEAGARESTRSSRSRAMPKASPTTRRCSPCPWTWLTTAKAA